MNALRAEKFRSRVRQQFAGHFVANWIATVDCGLGEEFRRVVWANGKRRAYAIEFLWARGTLFVTGNCGSAVYRFHGDMTLEDAADSELDYFDRKRVASDAGGYCSGGEVPLSVLYHYLGLRAALRSAGANVQPTTFDPEPSSPSAALGCAAEGEDPHPNPPPTGEGKKSEGGA